MTKAGKLLKEFETFKKEVYERLEVLEGKKPGISEEKKPKNKKEKDIILETKGDDIVATEE